MTSIGEVCRLQTIRPTPYDLCRQRNADAAVATSETALDSRTCGRKVRGQKPWTPTPN